MRCVFPVVWPLLSHSKRFEFQYFLAYYDGVYAYGLAQLNDVVEFRLPCIVELYNSSTIVALATLTTRRKVCHYRVSILNCISSWPVPLACVFVDITSLAYRALYGSRFGLGVRQEKISLPSAADLFDSVGVGSFMSPSGPANPATDSPATATPKRRKDAGSINRSSSSSSSSAKRNKCNAEGEKSGGVSKGLIPPQMSRPNIVTEDSALWSSDASVKRQRQTAAENKRAGGGAGKGKGVDEKGAKGSMTYKQREKVGPSAGRPGFAFFMFLVFCVILLRCRFIAVKYRFRSGCLDPKLHLSQSCAVVGGVRLTT